MITILKSFCAFYFDMGILQKYRWNKLFSQFEKTAYQLEYLKMEQQYLMKPIEQSIPILKLIIKFHAIKMKITSEIKSEQK